MKKYGKYEKMPDGTRAKQPGVKSVLLQTYLTSLLCLVLCVSMFFGTTFAWFTSEVKNEGNEIYVGMLDVGLEKFEDSQWVSLDPKTGSQTKLFDNSIKWEPGYTALETIRVTNEGELSFRYALTFANATIKNKWSAEANVEPLDIAEHFTVYVYEGAIPAGEEPKSFADIEASAAVAPDEKEKGKNYWRAVRMGTNPATLADILENGFPVLSGNMEAVLPEKTDPAATQPDYSNASNPTEQVWTIALHMDARKMPEEMLAQRLKDELEKQQMNSNAEIKTEEELKAEILTDWQDNVNAMMGHAINMNVKLTAHQRTHETDAFNKDYDLQAHVSELGDLDIFATAGENQPLNKMTLDVAYQFQPVETAAELDDSNFKNYVAEFVVWSEDNIPANSVALAGYYYVWCEWINDGNWIYLQSPDEIKANTKIPLVTAIAGYPIVSYDLLLEYGNDGIGFLCGVKNLSDANVGKKFFVELRLYETADDLDEEFGDGGKDTGNYIVAGRYEYTLEEPSGEIVPIS